MIDIPQTVYSNTFLLNESCCILIQMSMKFVSMGAVDNKLENVLVMALHQTDNKPSPELMRTQFTDVYKCHLASVC